MATSGNCVGGSLATAGGLVFNPVPPTVGNGKLLRAYDANSGAILGETPMDSSSNCPPMSYEVDGKQYLAIYACGRNSLVEPSTNGDMIHVYSLP